VNDDITIIGELKPSIPKTLPLPLPIQDVKNTEEYTKLKQENENLRKHVSTLKTKLIQKDAENECLRKLYKEELQNKYKN
jgi:molecular chaperone GrpE (heat shock protein)